MKKLFLYAILLFSISINYSFAQINEDSIRSTIERFSLGFQKGDINLINEELSPYFSLGMNSFPLTANYINPLLKDKGLASIEFGSFKGMENGFSLISVTAKLKNYKEVEGIIAIDSNYKIMFADVLDKLFGVSRYNKSGFKGSIPIEVYEDMITLKIKINDSDRPLKLLFDTGADGTALTKEAADQLTSITYADHSAQVVGGNVQVKKSSGNIFHLSDQISLKNQGFIVLKNSLRKETDGIIGLNIAKEYIIEVDLDKKVMNFYSFGDYSSEENSSRINICTPEGIMMIDGSVNIVGKKDAPGKFVFDTGASYHLIAFEGYVRKNRLLLSGFKQESQGTTVSLGVVSPTFSGKTHSFTFADKYTFKNMPITLQASTGRNNITTMSGSMGIQVIKQFNFTIDLLKKCIYLKPNNGYHGNRSSHD